MPKVSVIITTFNGATRGFLKEAIESVLNQTFEDFELLIIDDGSSDDTKEFCKKYLKDSRVKYFFKDNGGISSARNKGIKESIGDYICFLDDDDVWYLKKLEKQIKLFEFCEDEKIGLVHTWFDSIDKCNNKIGSYSSETAGNIYEDLFYKNVINATSSVMIKRKVFDKCGIFREQMIHVEDYELWFRIAKYFHVYSVNETLVKYRIHNINKLSQCYEKDFIFSQLIFFYVFENENKKNENRVLNRLCKKFAEQQFSIRNYKEFRKYCRFSTVYGVMGMGFRLRYFLSYFPVVVNRIKDFKYRAGLPKQ